MTCVRCIPQDSSGAILRCSLLSILRARGHAIIDRGSAAHTPRAVGRRMALRSSQNGKAGPLVGGSAAASDASGSSGSVLKLTVVGILALAAGFLVFNFSHILQVSHVHLSLTAHHKSTAFCAFIGTCKLGEEVAGTAKASSQQQKTAAQGSSTAAGSAASKAEEEDDQSPKKIAEITAILSTRVCGSPAVDGYAHVVPKCLEESPTNKWWQAYYKAGGKQEGLVVHIEQAADYDGLAVKWGLKNTVANAEECAQQCLKHMPNKIGGPFEKLPCNAFAFCPDDVCFEPDAHHHTKGDCWLKFTEGPVAPEVNMRGDLPPDYRARHNTAPARVQWISGVLLPPGVEPTNGTFGPRWKW